MNCIWCEDSIEINIYWDNVFKLGRRQPLCMNCSKKLSVLKGTRCKKCSRMCENDLCDDCLWWEKHLNGDFLDKNVAIFRYDDFLQEIVTKWKYRGDYILGYIYEQALRKAFKTLPKNIQKNAVVVPIPLSDERFMERGFNQSKMLATFLPCQFEEVLVRMHDEKQSKKSRYQRIYSKNPFRVIKEIKGPVILVDDIYTTGTTLRHAAKVLKDNGCPYVMSLTMARG